MENNAQTVIDSVQVATSSAVTKAATAASLTTASGTVAVSATAGASVASGFGWSQIGMMIGAACSVITCGANLVFRYKNLQINKAADKRAAKQHNQHKQ